MNLDHYLIVDDDADLGATLSLYFELNDLKSVYLPSGQLALEHLRKHSPLAVLTDYHMPGMTGLELYLSARQLNKQAPFLFMSGNMFQEEEVARKIVAHDVSLDYLLQKPFNFSELSKKLELIRAQLSQERLRYLPTGTDNGGA